MSLTIAVFPAHEVRVDFSSEAVSNNPHYIDLDFTGRQIGTVDITVFSGIVFIGELVDDETYVCEPLETVPCVRVATESGSVTPTYWRVGFEGIPDDLLGLTISTIINMMEAREAIHLMAQAVRAKDGTFIFHSKPEPRQESITPFGII